MASGAAQRERLVTVIEPAVTAAGYELEDVEVSPAGRRTVVRVVVDADGGVSLDDVAEVSRAVSDALDGRDDVLGSSPYVLEVSSPGVDRPLTEPRHWRRAVGRLVEVPIGGRTVRARVVGADHAAVELDTGRERATHPYGELGRGRVQVEFGRAVDTDGEEGR